MGSRPYLQPRASWTIRNLVATQVLAHALPALPVGYWQRRIAARAFALDVVPAMPRESQHVSLARLPGVPPIWVLASEVMTWGLVPWVWRGDTRSDRAEARAAVARVRAAARTPQCAAVFVASREAAMRLAHMPYLRLTGSAASVTAVGIITIEEIGAVLEEATFDLDGREGQPLASAAVRRVRHLIQDTGQQDSGLRTLDHESGRPDWRHPD
jgi:hypothetical protein